MKKLYLLSKLFLVAIILFSSIPIYPQGGFDDDRVMLQGFYWESYRHGYPQKFPGYGNKNWYEIIADQAEKNRAGWFDLICLPPPSYAGQFSACYNPKEYFNLNNSYGHFNQHRTMIKKLFKKGQLYVRVSGNDLDWQPYVSDYQNYREYAHGSG